MAMGAMVVCCWARAVRKCSPLQFNWAAGIGVGQSSQNVCGDESTSWDRALPRRHDVSRVVGLFLFMTAAQLSLFVVISLVFRRSLRWLHRSTTNIRGSVDRAAVGVGKTNMVDRLVVCGR